MSREYVEQRLRELGATPKRKAGAAPQPVKRAVWTFPGVRHPTPQNHAVTCDCHPDLQATANNYVLRARRESTDPENRATWFDVRNAFVIGYHIALEYERSRR